MKKTGVLALGTAIIVACLSLLVAGSYALFSDTVTIENHLQAGKLKATLVRTSHSYSILDEKGYLKETKVDSEYVDSKDMGNAFDLPDGALIVPMSELKASFSIKNNDTVAFDYVIQIVPKIEGEDVNTDNLSDQLIITLTGLTGTNTLSSKDLKVEGTESVEVGQSVDFTLTIEFKDDDEINNLVQDQKCSFDLMIYATQAID